MAVNKALLVGAMVGTAVLVGWMMMQSSSVVEPPAPVARHPPPAHMKADKPNATPVRSEAVDATQLRHGERKDIHLVVPQENLSLLYIVKCSACHGRDGKGPVGPSIAGKSYEENLKLLRRYKADEVPNTMMLDLLTRTSEDELKMLSREISAFKE